MRLKIVIICAIILTFCLWLLLYQRPLLQKNEPVAITTNQQLQSRPPKMLAAQTSTSEPPVVSQIETPRLPLTTNEIRERILADWQKPIDFYGKVIDGNSNPVEGAKVSFQWLGFADKRGTASTTSGADGLFSLRGKTGQNLHVSVEKNGYYVSRRDTFDFQYSLALNIYRPEEWNPVIFHLHKKGTPEPLMRLAGAMLGPRQYRLNANGTPSDISFYTGKRTPQGEGQFRVQYWMETPQNPGQQFRWRCQISVPGGGLQPTDEEFPFTAPEQGYQESFQMESDTNAWTYMPKQTFYVHLADGNYGRVKFSLNCSTSPFFGVEALINPSGSRNLEYDKYLPGNIMVDQSAP
jgi:hypothetical protein